MDENRKSLYEKAYQIAKEKHKNQKDKAGHPYFAHVLRVSELCRSDDAKIIALLHDTIEDTDTTPGELLKIFPAHIVIAVILLTKRPWISEETYFARIYENSLARGVKRADLLHNMDISRIPCPDEQDIERIKKYYREYLFLIYGKWPD